MSETLHQKNVTSEAERRILDVAANLGITMDAKFVPLSQSRNKDEKAQSLNWIVSLSRKDKTFLTTDYGAGAAFCPSYKQLDTNAPRASAVAAECETGYAHQINGMHPVKIGKRILPKLADVLSSLSMDADVLNHSSFEDWASDLGWDTDSRKAETCYRSCLDIALKLRNAIGEAGLDALREACQDY